MKISRRSWHYRLYRYISNVSGGPRYLSPFGNIDRVDKEPPPNLCPYAWAIFLGVIGVTVLALLGLALAPVILVGWFLYRIARLLDRHLWNWSIAKKPSAKKPKEKRERESLVGAYLKARHDRVCPKIELVD